MRERIFNISTKEEFEEIALQIFKIQSRGCTPYAQYIAQLEIDPDNVKSLDSIPFLPVTIFKSREVICGERTYEKIFTSSATTGVTPASHYVKELSIYEKSFLRDSHYFTQIRKIIQFLPCCPHILRERDPHWCIWQTSL